MSAVDKLRAANRHEMELENGSKITYRLPFMEELLIAQLLPLSIVNQITQRMNDGLSTVEAEAVAEASMEERLADYEHDFEAKQRTVALMVETLDGEPVKLTPEETLEIPAANFRHLVMIAVRQEVDESADVG